MKSLNTTAHEATLDALLAGAREAAMDDPTDRYNVPALERGLRMLGAFGEEDSVLSAPELVRRFDLPRSTVFRLLTTLESLGFVERSESGRDYRLGRAALRMGLDYLAMLEPTQLDAPLLQGLCEELDLPCESLTGDEDADEARMAAMAQRVRAKIAGIAALLNPAPAAGAGTVVPLRSGISAADPRL
ncbi:MAG: helix-turn-helix domain-containing protein [Variovorax sp.]|nr:helix-turn-helix domain-containing protein [Variovorax sp.]